MSNEVTAPKPAKPANADKDKIVMRGLNFLLRGVARAQRHQHVPIRGAGDGVHRPSGCGKSTLLRVLNRMYDLYPGQRAEGEVLLDGENILVARTSTSIFCAPASAWCSRSRRRSR